MPAQRFTRTERDGKMEAKNVNDMSSVERITYLVDLLNNYLFTTSLEARHALGVKPETAHNVRLLALIEGVDFGSHDTSGLMDIMDHLKAALEDEGMYESEDEDDEESDEESEDESDESDEVEA
jgi:hypothetical protein